MPSMMVSTLDRLPSWERRRTKFILLSMKKFARDVGGITDCRGLSLSLKRLRRLLRIRLRSEFEFIGVVLINTIGFPFLLNGIANHRHGISLIDIRKDMPYHYLPDIRVFFNNVFGEIFIQQNLVICV